MSPTAPLLDTSVVARRALAHDASHYLLIPEAIARPQDEATIIALLRHAAASGRPVTFRSGGTSLSGQAQSDAILADTRRGFRAIEVLDDGRRVRVGPGAVLGEVNAHLARHGRRLGPDPASEAACTIGGVIANNSSGMAAGIEQNSYRTLESLRFVLPSGTVVDTAAPDADARLRHDEPDLHRTLRSLMDRVRASAEATRVIRERFAMKNTMGYGVNALLDFDTVADALAHLVVGSEGTLAFVSSAVFRTVGIEPEVATGLMAFDSLDAAMGALPGIVDAGFATVELLDARSLVVAQHLARVPREIADLHVDGHAALLVEQRAGAADELRAKVGDADALAARLGLASPFAMTADPARRSELWATRKGLYAAVAGARPSGATALLEDVVVPVEALGSTCAALQELFARHGYDESVIFGHAKDGNIHFLLNEMLGDGSDRYEAFTEDMVELVLGAGGNLKAEHGTGRVMAPFVERQYGAELHAVMREIKRAIDPAGVLNPGVIITDDPEAHARDLKPVTTVEEEVDRCVECGYCEPVCPSRDLTLTPRQRIVLRRDAALARSRGDDATAEAIERAYGYAGVQTCAVDGMCGTACPVGINTGDLVRRLRAESASPVAERAWEAAADHWGAVVGGASVAVTAAGALPRVLPRAGAGAGRLLLGSDTVPSYRPELPDHGGARRVPGTVGRFGAPIVAVWMSACVHTMFGGGDALAALADRAGVRLLVPEPIEELCCGTPFSSKGMVDAKESMRQRLRDALGEAVGSADDGTTDTSEGAPTRADARDDTELGSSPRRRLPVVVDAASCTEGTMAALDGTDVEVVDAVTFARRELLPRLEVRERIGSATVHPTCSTTHLGATDDLIAVARACADDVVVPVGWGCCAYAGDRGMLHPELTASATAREAAEVCERPTDWYVSANRTCELGMSAATGQEYRHVLDLLEAVTR